MKKWCEEAFEGKMEVTGYLYGGKTEGYCRNGEEVGNLYTCTYGCPVNRQENIVRASDSTENAAIEINTMIILFPIMEAVRSGGNLQNLGGSGKYCKDVVCPDGCVKFRVTAKKREEQNFFKGNLPTEDLYHD